MAQFQIIGDKEKLSKGPRNSERKQFSGGSFQQVGDNVNLSQKPVPLQQGHAGTKGGQHQNVGEKVSLSPTPHKGWDSYSTPLSERAMFQSMMPGAKGNKSQ